MISLRVLGVEALAEYLINEIQDVYRLQGVENQRQAHRGDCSPDAAKVEVTNGGDSTFLVGEARRS